MIPLLREPKVLLELSAFARGYEGLSSHSFIGFLFPEVVSFPHPPGKPEVCIRITRVLHPALLYPILCFSSRGEGRNSHFNKHRDLLNAGGLQTGKTLLGFEAPEDSGCIL